MSALYEAPVAPFQWDPVRVRYFFSGRPKPDHDPSSVCDTGDSDLCFKVEIGKFYICRPPDDDETHSPFWIAEIAKRGRPFISVFR